MPEHILVAIYNPADLFPPTLNAIEVMAGRSSSIVLVTHTIEGIDQWVFPSTVEVISAGTWPRDLGTSGHIKNLKRFLHYVNVFARALAKKKYDLVMLYEPYAALAFKLVSWMNRGKPPILWYHSHDVYESKSQGKISIGRLAIHAERSIFSRLNVFSLPANERQPYYPMDRLKGKYFFIPNFPSVSIYHKFYSSPLPGTTLRLIFQGRIAEGHGLEEIIRILGIQVAGKDLSLHLKGILEGPYRDTLMALSQKYNTASRLNFYGLTSYAEVPKLAASCHVGIAIHTKTDIMNSTLGTSSNKIYEYAALGLPVLVYDNEHFRKHLGQYTWAFFTDCSPTSLLDCLEKIADNYIQISRAARNDFENELNFERYFMPALAAVESGLPVNKNSGLN